MMSNIFKEYAPYFTLIGAVVMFLYFSPKFIARFRGARLPPRERAINGRLQPRVFVLERNDETGENCRTKHKEFGACQVKLAPWRALPSILAFLYTIPLILNLLIPFGVENTRKALYILSVPLVLLALTYLLRLLSSLTLYERGLRIRGLFSSNDLRYDEIEAIAFEKRGVSVGIFAFWDGVLKKLLGAQWRDQYVVLELRGGRKSYIKASQYRDLFAKFGLLKQAIFEDEERKNSASENKK